jgi:hypothetical protein
MGDHMTVFVLLLAGLLPHPPAAPIGLLAARRLMSLRFSPKAHRS